MRFIQGTTTAFLQPSTPKDDYSRTLCIDQFEGTTATTQAVTTVNVFTGAAPNDITKVLPTINVEAGSSLTAVGAQCRMKYGQSV